mmetsp:Transcript_15180/g.41599  ORF Transcript_15180/g.41599 Transcript_15180/m.41599 type:complete len:139 (-) Transcript_15180:25-441(-)
MATKMAQQYLGSVAVMQHDVVRSSSRKSLALLRLSSSRKIPRCCKKQEREDGGHRERRATQPVRPSAELSALPDISTANLGGWQGGSPRGILILVAYVCCVLSTMCSDGNGGRRSPTRGLPDDNARPRYVALPPKIIY